MKRGLVFSLCALVAAASASSAMAQATIQASLNLRYTNPANPADGGTWTLVAKTDDDDGIAALVAYLQNSGNVASTDIATNIGSIEPVGDPAGPALLDRTGGVLEIVYGQDMTAAGTVLGVGTATFGPRLVNDPLKNAAWNNASIIATGEFAGVRPTFTTFGGHNTDGNTLPDTVNGSTPAVAANATTVVRGDSERSLNLEGVNEGLYAGDANRDGTVNAADLALLLNNYDDTGRGWGDGNFNNTAGSPNTVVNAADLALLLNNYDKVANPISVAAVPEPQTLLLAAGGVAMALVGLRKKS